MNSRASISDLIFRVEGVESISINKIDDNRFAVKTNMNRIIPFIVDIRTMNDDEIMAGFAEHISDKRSNVKPKVDNSYKSRLERIALLVDVSMDEVCGWCKTDLPSGRVVIDIEDETKTPMVIRRDKTRAGRGVDSLENHWVVNSQPETPSSNLIDISGASK